jgi:beta-xylosidase
VVVTVDVANTGERRGDEVVQLYVRDAEASVARPVLELLGFRRVALEPGEARSVAFLVSVEQLSYTGADYRRVIEPGAVEVFAGSSSVDLPLTATLTLVGRPVHLLDRTRYLTGTWFG